MWLSTSTPAPLLVISFDGFRDSYLQLNITPNIQRIFDCGTHSKFMIPVFPSKTFPNHYSIVTGLYPTWHGIVNNLFRDPDVPGVSNLFFLPHRLKKLSFPLVSSLYLFKKTNFYFTSYLS
ncbi:unnamed protein product [Enterobius vermicularis]|uniref:Ectonucleotide pyrophosphatase/phosphodiesterase family member 3 n=1 Tax=Enterobius vermicularis TaxID=51028 RepID=A0A0N4V4J0_ENTVE|nr:unnamed protein product [Enterobius vermicularis]